MKNNKEKTPFILLDNYGKVLVLPMQHKKRMELINFLNYLYLDKPFKTKDFMRETFDGCYLVVISDLTKNEFKRKFNTR